MTAERESMTLQEMGAAGPASSRSVDDRGPQAPLSQPSAGRPTPDVGGRGQAEEAQVHRAVIDCGFWRRSESCTQPGEVGRLLRR